FKREPSRLNFGFPLRSRTDQTGRSTSSGNDAATRFWEASDAGGKSIERPTRARALQGQGRRLREPTALRRRPFDDGAFGCPRALDAAEGVGPGGPGARPARGAGAGDPVDAGL